MSQNKNKNDKAIVKQSVWWDKMFKAVVQLVDLVRKRKRKRDLPQGFFKHWDFFVHVRFFADLKSKYNGVEVVKDEKNKKIVLKGSGDTFYGASNDCDNVLHKLVKKKMVLEDSRMWDVIDGNDEQIKEIMASKKIKAKVCFDVFQYRPGQIYP